MLEKAGANDWRTTPAPMTVSVIPNSPAIAGCERRSANISVWRAASAEAIPEGARMRIVRVSGLTLYDEPVESPSRSGPGAAAGA